jgi:hypothetical protein
VAEQSVPKREVSASDGLRPALAALMSGLSGQQGKPTRQQGGRRGGRTRSSRQTLLFLASELLRRPSEFEPLAKEQHGWRSEDVVFGSPRVSTAS